FLDGHGHVLLRIPVRILQLLEEERESTPGFSTVASKSPKGPRPERFVRSLNAFGQGGHNFSRLEPKVSKCCCRLCRHHLVCRFQFGKEQRNQWQRIRAEVLKVIQDATLCHIAIAIRKFCKDRQSSRADACDCVYDVSLL